MSEEALKQEEVIEEEGEVIDLEESGIAAIQIDDVTNSITKDLSSVNM